MDSTLQLLESLERVLTLAPSAIFHDEFQVLDIKIESLHDALTMLNGLLAEEQQGTIKYQRAVVKVAQERDDRTKINHVIRRDEVDILLTAELLEKNWLCNNHAEAYENSLRDQDEVIEFNEWQRYSLIQEVVDCSDCKVNAWVEITLDKNVLEAQIKERIKRDIPKLTKDLENIRIFYWANFFQFYSMIEDNLQAVHKTIADWGKPCLFICLENAENDGSDYIKSISTSEFIHLEVTEPILIQLLNVPSLQSLSRSRESFNKGYPESVGYLPPEYWINAQMLAHAFSEEDIPNWFKSISPFFVYSILATVSSTVLVHENNIRFEIKREFELALECFISREFINIYQNNNTIKVNLTKDVLHQLLNFFSTALHGKYTSINRDLIQRSIVYGTKFTFEAFFSQLEQINRFYEFEYKHLLGDRFDQQSRTLSTFISDMMGLRQQLASLIDSLSKDLSGLTIAVLATTALAIVAKVIDINTWDNLVIYGIATSFIFAYFYITVFLLRIDNLKDLGERAVNGFIQDVELSQQIWDYPIHSIGVEDKDLDRDKILKPLVSQYKTNQFIGEITGVITHILFLSLAISMKLWWFPVPILILDTIFLGRSILSKNRRLNRLVYYSITWFMTLIFAGVFYWIII